MRVYKHDFTELEKQIAKRIIDNHLKEYKEWINEIHLSKYRGIPYTELILENLWKSGLKVYLRFYLELASLESLIKGIDREIFDCIKLFKNSQDLINECYLKCIISPKNGNEQGYQIVIHLIPEFLTQYREKIQSLCNFFRLSTSRSLQFIIYQHSARWEDPEDSSQIFKIRINPIKVEIYLNRFYTYFLVNRKRCFQRIYYTMEQKVRQAIKELWIA